MSQPLSPDSFLPILGVRAGDIARRCLVVGDPARATMVAERFDDVEEVGRSREYVTYRGVYGGQSVGVVSHGVGGPGAAVCFEELARAGVSVLIRAGTCGGMQRHVNDGDVVIAHGAVRAEGFTPRLVPLAYPAVSSIDAVLALRGAAAARERAVVEGMVLTNDLFYPHDVLGSDLELWQRAGVVAVEMEVASLLIVAALHGITAGAVLACDGNPLAQDDADMAGYDPHRQIVVQAVEDMITIALDALISLPEQ